MRKYVWHAITNLGDTSILLPCAVLVAVVLLLPASTRRLCVVWLAILVAGGTIVATTNVLYMGWRLGIASLDFAGLSGHSTLSFLVWPVAFALLLGRTEKWQSVGVAFGILLASVIAVSRLALHAHSIAEVVFGGILGAALSSAFLVRYRRLLHVVALPRWLAMAMILPFVIGYGRVMPTESILAAVARTLSGHSYVYTRTGLHSGTFRLKTRTRLDPKWSIVPVGGADLIPTFVALLGGHLKSTVLVDSRKDGHQRLERMAKDGYLEQQRIVLVGDIIGRKTADIEDLFEEQEYIDLYNRAFGKTLKSTDLKGNDPIVARIARHEGVDRTTMADPLTSCSVNEILSCRN